MKRISFFLTLFLVLVVGLAFAFAQNTTIYVVRHAEKETIDPKEQDPDLSAVGKQRAFDLLKHLEKERIDVVFSTKFKRNMQTVAPILAGRKLPINYYEAHNFSELKNSIEQFHLGNTILIVGHSNTVAEICEALGAKPNIPKLTDADYSYIFKIQLDKSGKASISVSHYGTKASTN